MAHPSIGGYEMISLSGALSPVGEVSEDITRPGADGHAHKLHGYRAPVTTHETLSDFASAVTADAAIVNYKLAMGSRVSVVTAHGAVYTNVHIVNVDPTIVRAVSTPVGGVVAGPWLVRAVWQLQCTSLP